jgi:lysophospholipase L1-like esterase
MAVSRGKKLLFAAVPLLLVLLLAEGVQRISDWRKSRKRPPRWVIPTLETTRGLPLGDPHGGIVWTLDPFLLYRNRPSQRSAAGSVVNAQGFRGADWTREKRPGVARVFVLGGSVAWGWGIDDDAQAIPALMQARLGPSVEVLNAAVIGYLSVQELILLETELLDWSPDAIVVLDGWNDFYFAALTPEGERPTSITFRELEAILERGRETGRNVLRQSALWRGVERRVAGDPVHARVCRDRPEVVPAYRRNLEVMARLGKAYGLKVVLASQPEVSQRTPPVAAELADYFERELCGEGYFEVARARYPALRAAARDVAAANDATFVDCTPVVDAVPGDAFVDGCHLTPAGNAAVADALADAVARALSR